MSRIIKKKKASGGGGRKLKRGGNKSGRKIQRNKNLDDKNSENLQLDAIGMEEGYEKLFSLFLKNSIKSSKHLRSKMAQEGLFLLPPEPSEDICAKVFLSSKDMKPFEYIATYGRASLRWYMEEWRKKLDIVFKEIKKN